MGYTGWKYRASEVSLKLLKPASRKRKKKFTGEDTVNIYLYKSVNRGCVSFTFQVLFFVCMVTASER